MSNHKDAEPYLRRAHSTQVTGFTWEFTGRSLTVRGNCPRCEGETDYQPPTDVQVGATKGPGPRLNPAVWARRRCTWCAGARTRIPTTPWGRAAAVSPGSRYAPRPAREHGGPVHDGPAGPCG
ncbi:hypothetical protein Sfulv_15310 [Streptomyces fulvorobeus]|uniref:Uncharacterized protein n=1 Tax=Streptomyces fulvorobeus TaxID=284028 RepID=A0A7J0C2I4_9ACTN|nr:hypothetical protein Sfulv_15310 [Streptomyces fulvorobeus]